MPVLGADMEVGTVAEWRVGPGDRVRRGDIVAVIATDKADVDAESFEDGIVREIVVDVGQEVPVGTVLAELDPVGDRPGPAPTPSPPPSASAPPSAPPSTPPSASAPAPAPPSAPEPAPEPAPVAPPPAATTDDRPPASSRPAGHPWPEPATVPGLITSPLVRHLAEQRDVDPSRIVGTGPGHRVTRADIEHAPTGRAPAAGPRHRASPLARRRARTAGIDLGDVRGSGPGGAVLAADVERAGRPTERHTPTGGRDVDASGRRAVAVLMARSKREIPHYYLQRTIDLGATRAWLTEANRQRPVEERILPAAVLLAAVARAAARTPRMNGFWVDDQLVTAEAVHLGVAIARRGGLVAPAIERADLLGVGELMAQLRGLVARVRAGRLRTADLVEPTITVTNLGERGTDAVFGVIYPPQVAMVGFGTVADRPAVWDGELAVRPTVMATLSGDHRASDGRDGARFLLAIEQHLQEPDALA